MAAKLVTAVEELASRIRDFEAIAAPNNYVLEESLGLFWLKPINPAIEKVWKYWRELWGQLPAETEIANWETARAEDCDFRHIAGARVRGLEMVRTLLLGMLNCYPSPEDDVLFPPVIAGTVAGIWVGWPWGHSYNGGKSPDDDELPALPRLNASLAQIETAIGLLRSGELELATDRNGSPTNDIAGLSAKQMQIVRNLSINE